MKRFDSRWAMRCALLITGALWAPTPASAHCGEHADSCSVPFWQEAIGGSCVDAADPFDYGTWMQPYELIATLCQVPIRCVQAACTQDADCGANSTCVFGANGFLCSCPPGKLAPCAICKGPCVETTNTVAFPEDLRCWPSTIEDSVPCAGPLAGGSWRNHGQYVSAVAALLNAAVVTDEQHDALMEGAGESSCGK
jgi:hypothetical protein